MADKQESALTQQSDCKWVRALDSNGNSILISKEDLASVVGELLPIVSNEKNGLVSSYYSQSFPNYFNITTTYLKLIQHSTMGAWNATFIDILVVRGPGGNSGRIVIAISSDGSSTKNISIFKSGNPDAKILKDSQYIYIQKTYMYGVKVSITTTNNFPLILEGLSEVPADATEVQ